MSKKKTYLVHSPLRHDGKTYHSGGKVSLTGEEAEPLLSAGVIFAPEETEKPEEPEKEEAATEQAGTATKQKGSAGKAGSGKKGNG